MEKWKKQIALAIILVIVAFSFSGCIRTSDVGDTVKFGSYKGDKLEWIVLAKDGNKTLLISKYVIDTQPYDDKNNPVKWEDSSLMEWLNEDFYEEAFGVVEKTRIADTPLYEKEDGDTLTNKVFLLDSDEIVRYFPDENDRSTRFTMYVLDCGYDYGYGIDGSCAFWVRPNDTGFTGAYLIGTSGKIFESRNSYGYQLRDKIGVRPAIWVVN